MSIKASIGWTASSRILGSILQFASSVVLARILLPEEVGVFAVSAATIGILSIIQQLGLPALIIRETTVSRDLEATAFTVNFIFALIVTIIIAGAGSLATILFGDARVANVMYVLALNPLIVSFSFLPAAHLERAGNFKVLAIVATASSMAIALSTIAMLVLGLRYMSLAYAQVIGSVVTSVLFIWTGRRFPAFIIGINEWRRVALFSSRVILIGGAYNISQRISEMSLAKLVGLAPLGLYNRASSISGLIWGNVHSVIGRVYLVDFARANREGESIAPRYLRTMSVLVAILWPAYLGIALLSPYILTTIYGAKWAAAAMTLSYFCIAAAVGTSVSLSSELFLATGNVDTQARLEVKRAVLSTSLFVIGALISLEAAAATRIVDAIIAISFYWPHVKKMTGMTSKDFRSTYRTGALLTLLALLPSAAVRIFYPEFLENLGGLICVIIGGILLWAVGLFLLSHPLYETIRTLLPRFRRAP